MLAQAAVERAYREAAIKRIGDVPTVDEYTEGLDRLNGFLDSLFGAEIGRLLTDVQVPLVQRTASQPSAAFHQPFPNSLSNVDQPIGALEQLSTPEYVVPPNSRILWRSTVPERVFLSQNPEDGARVAVVDTGSTADIILDGNGRRVNSTNTVTLQPGFPPITYFYRADLANWIPLAQLTLTDNLPLPAEFNRLVICGTAISLTALDEIKPTEGTLFMFNRLLRRCNERYLQRQAVSPGGQDLVNADQAFEYGLGLRSW
jgi:hypothetical protein